MLSPHFQRHRRHPSQPNCGSQGPHFPTIHIGRMGEVKVKCSWLSRVKSTSQSADALLPLRLAQRSKNVQKNHPTQATSFMIPMLFHCFKSMKKSDWPYFQFIFHMKIFEVTTSALAQKGTTFTWQGSIGTEVAPTWIQWRVKKRSHLMATCGRGAKLQAQRHNCQHKK